MTTMPVGIESKELKSIRTVPSIDICANRIGIELAHPDELSGH